MTQKIVKYLCLYCEQELDSSSNLNSHLETSHPSAPGWGRGVYPLPKGVAFIDADVMKCVGCGLCAEACSMQHYGIINKDFARIYVRNFLLPLPKAIVLTFSDWVSSSWFRYLNLREYWSALPR